MRSATEPAAPRRAAWSGEIVGAPDYERYLEHQAARHPGRAPLTPREYYAEFVTRRFGSAGPTRCC